MTVCITLRVQDKIILYWNYKELRDSEVHRPPGEQTERGATVRQ